MKRLRRLWPWIPSLVALAVLGLLFLPESVARAIGLTNLPAGVVLIAVLLTLGLTSAFTAYWTIWHSPSMGISEAEQRRNRALLDVEWRMSQDREHRMW